MRKRITFAFLSAGVAVTAACTGIVGDFDLGSAPGENDGGGSGDSAGHDGTVPNGDAPGGNDARPPGDAPPGDGGPSDGAEAAVLCGYPGEQCCSAPFSPCNQGTACVANKCKLNDVWAVGAYLIGFSNAGASMHYDGTQWTVGPGVPLTPSTMESNPYATSLWGAGPNQYELVTTGGKVVEFTPGSPASWRECSPTMAPCAFPNTQAALWGIYGFNFSDYWIGGTNVMFHCDNATCTSTTTGLPSSWGQGTFTGTSSSDLWYPQFDHAFHYDGTKWTTTSGIQARAMWAHAANDVWAGDLTLQHFDGTTWSQPYNLALPDGGSVGNVFAISGTATDDIWAVGYLNTTSGANIPFSAHWDGMKWSLVPVPAAAGQVGIVWAGARDEAFLTGGPNMYKWDGTAWTAQTLPPQADYPDASFGPPGWGFVFGSAKHR